MAAKVAMVDLAHMTSTIAGLSLPQITPERTGLVKFVPSWAFQLGPRKSGERHPSDRPHSGTESSRATFAFTGTAARWIGGQNVNHGLATVQICDGSGLNCNSGINIDTYASSWMTQQILYSTSGLASGAHTLKITVTSSQNPNSSGIFQDVDAFAYS